MQSRLLSDQEEKDLVKKLLALSFTNTSSGRRQLLAGLPSDLRDSIDELTAPKPHLSEIVSKTNGWGQQADGTWPIILLVQNAYEQVEESQAWVELQTLEKELKKRATQATSPPIDPETANPPDIGLAGATPPPTPNETPIPSGGNILQRYLNLKEISYEDKTAIKKIIQNIPLIFRGKPNERIQFLLDTGWPRDLVAYYSWDDTPSTVAGQMVDEAERLGTLPASEQPGYKVLGAMISHLLDDATVGIDDARFLASVVVRYQLIDLKKAKISPALQSLLQIVPEPLRTAGAAAGLEAAVRDAHGFLDQYLDANWLSKGAYATQAVCRVEVSVGTNTPIYGTGFLLGPDLVLTNYHVVDAAILGEQGRTNAEGYKATHSDIVLRFGYRVEESTTPEKGQEYRLLDSPEWLVDYSPQEDPDGLDYALLRIDGSPGEDPLRLGSGIRGWITPSVLAPAPQVGDAMFIIQHPRIPGDTQSAPLKVVLSYNAVNTVTPKRVTYMVNTEKGSSGSPCFAQDWSLTALHHAGWEDQHNEGIPIAAILTQPKVKQALQEVQNR